MNILTYIPVYQRREVTDMCYKGLQRLYSDAPCGLNIQTLIIASTLPDAKLAHKYGFDVRMADNKPLGAKFNKGLEYALSHYDFDYLFQINSDNILHESFWEYFSPFLFNNKPFFGCNHIAFYNLPDGRLIQYLYPDGCGIRFIRRDILEGTATKYLVDNPSAAAGVNFVVPKGKTWVSAEKYKERYGSVLDTKIELWPPERNSMLDDSSTRAIREAYGPMMRQAFPKQDKPVPLVIDIKSATNIHPFSEFEGDRFAKEIHGEDKEVMLSWFPEVKATTNADTTT